MPLPSLVMLRGLLCSFAASPPARRAASMTMALLPGLAVLAALDAGGAFSERTTPVPVNATPSPWWPAARAVDDGACQLSVRVHDGQGDAIAGARLQAVRLERGVVVERIEALTDARGVWRAIDLASGTWDVTVDVAGRALQGTPSFACDRRGVRASFAVAVDADTRDVVGRVTGDGRKALAQATVAFFQDDAHRTGLAGVVRTDTDAEGRFGARLAPGTYVALVTAREHVARRLTIHVDEARTSLPVRLAWSPAVRGTVVDDVGRPLAGAVVSMGGAFDPRASAARVVADDDGRFEMPVQQGQELSLTARAAGLVGRALLGTVDDARHFQHVTLVATAGRNVGGVVIGPDGAARAFAPVHFRVRALGLEGDVVADARGRFLLDGMPGDDVEVWVTDNATGAWGAQVADASTSQLALAWTPPAW